VPHKSVGQKNDKAIQVDLPGAQTFEMTP